MISHSNITPASHTVLIVDDDPAMRNSLQFCLEVEGFLVRAYACGADLLNDPNIPESGCLVIDYRLPGMNGLDLLSELRRREITFRQFWSRHIQVLLCVRARRRLALSSLRNHCLMKPCSRVFGGLAPLTIDRLHWSERD